MTMYRNGDRVRVTDLNGVRESCVTGTGTKNDEPIVFLDDGTWVYTQDIVEMTGTKRLTAVFQPQAWVNNYAVDTDGAVEFDATEALLGRDLDYIHRYAECSYDSDALADDLPERQNHSGPFEVECDVWAWLEENGVSQKQTMSQAELDRLRTRYEVNPRGSDGDMVACQNCGHTDDPEEFAPTDGRPDKFGCPKCGSSNCYKAD
jgi:hypothetical protein